MITEVIEVVTADDHREPVFTSDLGETLEEFGLAMKTAVSSVLPIVRALEFVRVDRSMAEPELGGEITRVNAFGRRERRRNPGDRQGPGVDAGSNDCNEGGVDAPRKGGERRPEARKLGVEAIEFVTRRAHVRPPG